MPGLWLLLRGSSVVRSRRSLYAVVFALSWTLTGSACGSAPEQRVTLTGTVELWPDEVPLVGMEVCVLEPPGFGCAETDQAGEFSLKVPPDSEVVLELGTQEPFQPMLMNVPVGQTDQPVWDRFFRVVDRFTISMMEASVGMTLDDDRGHIAGWITDGYPSVDDGFARDGMVGAVVSLDPDAGGVGLYMTRGGSLEDLEAVTIDGGFTLLNLQPGGWELTVTHPDRECKPYSAFPGSGPNRFRVVVAADHHTMLMIYCE